MKDSLAILVRLFIWRDERGQDLIEYALMAGLVAAMTGAIMPGAVSGINDIFSRVNSALVLSSSS